MADKESSEEKPDSADHDELKKVTDLSQDVLIKAESVFPFNLFPDTVSVNRVKVSVSKRLFFRVAEVRSMQIEDVLNIEADVGPIFGSVIIYTRIMGIDPLKVTFLTRAKALEVKRVLEGYIIAKGQGLDTQNLKTDELRKLLERLGSEKSDA